MLLRYNTKGAKRVQRIFFGDLLVKKNSRKSTRLVFYTSFLGVYISRFFFKLVHCRGGKGGRERLYHKRNTYSQKMIKNQSKKTPFFKPYSHFIKVSTFHWPRFKCLAVIQLYISLQARNTHVPSNHVLE